MRFIPVLLSSLFATGLAAGCAADLSDSDSSDQQAGEIQERTKLGKADDPNGSCIAPNDALYCGGKSGVGSCWCDDACVFYNDCCTDYTATCVDNSCDPTLVCTQVLTCVEGKLYPTGCGPANCDEPIGPCDDDGGSCEPMDAQGQGPCLAFFGVTWNGSSCAGLSGCSCVGDDCDKLFQSYEECQDAYADCEDPPPPPPPPLCDPTLICTQVLTCVAGDLYPTGCGPANCDSPIGGC